MSVSGPRMFRGNGRDHLIVVALLMLAVLATFAAVALTGGDRNDPDGQMPWTLLPGLATLLWMVCAATAAIGSSQRVETGADGSFRIRGPSTGFRWRCVHADDVERIHYGNWQHIRRSVVSDLSRCCDPARSGTGIRYAS